MSAALKWQFHGQADFAFGIQANIGVAQIIFATLVKEHAGAGHYSSVERAFDLGCREYA